MVLDWRLRMNARSPAIRPHLHARRAPARRGRDRARSGAHLAAVKKTTQIIAIYGKGGIGKSFTLANLSYMMAQQGKKVLLIGCDPKSDTTSCCSAARPARPSSRPAQEEAGRREVAIGDVCFKRDGVFAMELGGPEVGRGCGGRGIIHGFETLEKLGFHDWGFDYVLLDFLGDVVCGGFGLPIARDMCQKVIVVASNDLQSLYVANNVCSAVEYFRKLGGNVGVAGMVINRDDGTGEAKAFAEQRRHPGAGHDPGQRGHPPQERQLRDHRPPRHAVGAAVRGTGHQRGRGAAGAPEAADAGPAARPVLGRGDRARLQDGAGHLFDMVGKTEIVKPTLEVVYDAA
jgi:chlorophyllide a reductase subunit X